MKSVQYFYVLIGLLALGTCGAHAQSQDKPLGKLEEVARFKGSMPTGVTVSRGGRIFVNFPRWGDPVPFTVAEVVDGRTVAYPDVRINRLNRAKPQSCFVSVQSVVVDAKERLWILDTGAPLLGAVIPGGAKLIAVNLRTNQIVKTIRFPQNVALPTTYLNDIRFDLRQGAGGVAYITDSGEKSPNGIIVVDLQSGKSWRKLDNHPSVKAEKRFLPLVEGRPVMVRKPGQPPKHLGLGSDGIAISADGTRLFYCPLASRNLYSVSTKVLRDESLSADDVAKTVVNHGDKGGGSDGLESDSAERIYTTQYEHNAITRRLSNGLYETVAHDPHLLWPDTLSVASNGYLYVIANQLHRQKNYNHGKDLREKPYLLYRVKVDAAPVRLK